MTRRARNVLGFLVMGLIATCGAVWSFGALVEIGNAATVKANLTTLPAPYAGWLFAGSVDLFIFFGYLKCYGPAWQIVLAVAHILLGLATSVWLQYQHSMGRVDPVLVSVIPPLAVAVSLDTWVVSQLIDWRRHGVARAGWPIPTPLGKPVPQPDQPEPDQPEPDQTRTRVAQVVPRRERPATLARPRNGNGRTYAPLSVEQARRVEQLRADGWSLESIGQAVGATRQRVGAHLRNGNGDHS